MHHHHHVSDPQFSFNALCLRVRVFYAYNLLVMHPHHRWFGYHKLCGTCVCVFVRAVANPY